MCAYIFLGGFTGATPSTERSAPLRPYTCAAIPLLQTSTSNEMMKMLAVFATTLNMMPFRWMQLRQVELHAAPVRATQNILDFLGPDSKLRSNVQYNLL